MVGFERLYKDGVLAVVHGCGYDHPSLSHFSSMGFWHTGVPNGGEPLGWLGRLADEGYDAASRNVIVNVGNSQSLAVRSRQHSPLVFDDPARFRREGTEDEKHMLAGLSQARTTTNATLEFLATTAQNAADSSDFVRQASASYRTPVDYGSGGGLGVNLQRVAALIAAGMPTRIYYVSYAGNSFDTHVQQADLHSRLLMYTADAVRGFIEDMKRIGRADDVAVMIVHRVRTARRRERQPRHRSRHGDADVRHRQGRQGRPLRTAPEPHRSRRRQPEDDDGLQARLRDHDQGVARLRRHTPRSQGRVRSVETVRLVQRAGPNRYAHDGLGVAVERRACVIQQSSNAP